LIILLLIAALNDLEIMGRDVQNAFLSADNLEKHWLKAGPEFGAEQGKTFIVVRAMCYVDDILAISMKATEVLLESLKSEKIKFKNNKIAEPEMYLGARLQKKQIN